MFVRPNLSVISKIVLISKCIYRIINSTTEPLNGKAQATKKEYL